MRLFLLCLGIFVFGLAAVLAWHLLDIGKFSGTEFTAFVVAFAVIGLVLGFAPEVQEISVAGNVVKLKEIKNDAVKAIESLNKARIEMLRTLLGLAMRHGGGLGDCNQLVDPRAADIWPLFRLSKEYDCQKELKAELDLSVKALMISQLNSLKWVSKDVSIVGSEPFMTPFDLASLVFDLDKVGRALSARGGVPDNYREDVKIILNEYSKLYEFNVGLESFK